MHDGAPNILTELRENENRTVEARIDVTFYAGSGLIAREIEEQIIRLIGTANIFPNGKADDMVQRHMAQRDNDDPATDDVSAPSSWSTLGTCDYHHKAEHKRVKACLNFEPTTQR